MQAIAAPEAEFDLARLPGLKGARPALDGDGQVIGMDHHLPAFIEQPPNRYPEVRGGPLGDEVEPSIRKRGPDMHGDVFREKSKPILTLLELFERDARGFVVAGAHGRTTIADPHSLTTAGPGTARPVVARPRGRRASREPAHAVTRDDHGRAWSRVVARDRSRSATATPGALPSIRRMDMWVRSP